MDPLFVRRMLHARRETPPTPYYPPPRPAGPITLKDDAFHFRDYASSPGAFWYTEWWYFNFHDPAQDLGGICTIAVFNPGNQYDLGAASLTAAVFAPGAASTTPVVEYDRLASFAPSYEKADIRLGASRIEVVDASTYRVISTTRDGSIALDLTYTRRDEPQWLANDVHGHDEPWEISSWLVYMPCASVSGTVRWQGKTYTLRNATGYHDHDWGMWHEYAKTWSWAYVSNPDREISFDLGFHAAFQLSDAYFRWKDVRLIIPEQNFKITQDDWEPWELFWKYPKSMTFSAVDPSGEYRVELAWKVQDTAAIWKYPVIVFEQKAKFSGSLSRKNGSDWQTLAQVDDTGFCEYTSLWI